MPTTLVLNFDLESMKRTAIVSKFFARLVSMSFALRLTMISHEISGLILFHAPQKIPSTQ